ncbi:hypothetical protein [Alishewanella phage vB_AspM_Slicko01]|nr:hypothetical protein [Alishewanella phage vB_AspM_Slicko01]
MKIDELYESMITESVSDWYHGSPKKFEKFDLAAERMNRGSNPTGIYLTKNYDLAKEYAGTNGYIYKVMPMVRKIFIERKTPLDSKIAASYKKALLKYTNYKSDWIDSTIIPEMMDAGRLKNDLDGKVKTETYAGAGYDGCQFVDMFDVSLVVFDTKNVKILGRRSLSEHK